jgi:nucleoside-diphosphate-sugar epimerase
MDGGGDKHSSHIYSVRNGTFQKINEILGYQPKVGIDEGLRITAEWYKKEGYL